MCDTSFTDCISNLSYQVISMVASYNRDMYEYGKNVRRYGTEHELRIDQTHIIAYIGHNPECKLKDIADNTSNSLSTVSLQITRLIRLGLVKKMRSKQNQREIILTLTEAGQRVYEFHEDVDRKWIERLSDRLSVYKEDELRTIKSFLEVISDPQLNNI